MRTGLRLHARAKGGIVNARRVAALLRELADAIDEPAPVMPVKRRRLVAVRPPAQMPDAETLAKVQRAVRRLGVR